MLGDLLAYRLNRMLAARPRFDREVLHAQGYASQFGQDRWVVEALLGGLRGGVFCDVGAYDGTTVSNTLALERDLGWTGVAVEANPDACAQLRAVRRCCVVQAAVSDREGVAMFERLRGHAEMLSGLAEAYPPQHRRRIAREIAAHGGSVERVEVPTVRLDAVLQAAGIGRVDYLSIDVEGAELSVLRGAPIGELEVRVIGVENNYADWRVHAHLAARGYRLVGVLGCDEIYVPSPSRARIAGRTTSRTRR